MEFFLYSETGFVDGPLFKTMIEKVQELWKLRNPGLDLYLLGDNCRIHLQLKLMLDMFFKGIHSIFIPPNTTHFLQPLDQDPFGALKSLV